MGDEKKTPEELEWERAARVGRKRTLAKLVAVVTGALATALTLYFMTAYLDASGEQIAERIAQGEVVMERQGPRTTLGMLALPAVVGLVVGAVTFTLLGGKLAPEYMRGLGGD
jgi:hypothetical protein